MIKHWKQKDKSNPIMNSSSPLATNSPGTELAEYKQPDNFS